MSKERRKGNPPTPTNLAFYTLCRPPSNHSSCSDVPSEYPTLILPTTHTTPISTTMPHHPTSQHLRPLFCHNKLYHHHLTTFLHHLHFFPCLRLSVTLTPPISPIQFLSTFILITPNLSHDTWLYMHSGFIYSRRREVGNDAVRRYQQ